MFRLVALRSVKYFAKNLYAHSFVHVLRLLQHAQHMHIPMPPRTSHCFRDSNKPNLFRKINRKENVPKSVPKGIKIDEKRCGKRVKGDGQLASSIINPTGRREELCIPHHRWRSVCRKKAKMNEEGAEDTGKAMNERGEVRSVSAGRRTSRKPIFYVSTQ